jgi:fructose-bisphosphate aldolase class II
VYDVSKPIPGDVMYKALMDKGVIIMAANVRVTPGVTEGIFRAAKDLDSAVIFEIAKSECNLERGYTGMVPSDYSGYICKAADVIDHDAWALHADHITIKDGTPEEVQGTKALIDAQIDSGFTSFAIDASHLYDLSKVNIRDALSRNIDVTTELAKHIENRVKGDSFGLEVEVGEIGKKNEHGHVLTTPDEAVTFLKALRENDVHPQVLAIANGSTHGNVYDEHGNIIEQVSIDIPQTKAVAKAIRENRFDVRIAQHGITGTPRELINSIFPKGDILKGNVATFWQNVVLDAYKVYEPELYRDIYNWTIETYKPKNPTKADKEIFGSNVKNALKEFYDRIHAVDPETTDTIEAIVYAEARVFFKAFSSKGSAEYVRKAL